MLVDCVTIRWYLLIVTTIVLFAIIWKIYLKLSIKCTNSYTCMVGKVVVITGANSGIGYITALDLAKRGAKIILACRNVGRAQRAAEEIRYETGNRNVSYKILDMASFESVRNFAKEINETEENVDVLINNAGIGGLDDQTTEDGNLVMLQVNYLSHFLLTHLLISKLKKSPSRIINLSSSMAKHSNLSLKNLNDFTQYSYFVHDYMARSAVYANAKLCSIYSTKELSRRLQSYGVTVNVVHPGSVWTGIWDVPKPFEQLVKLIAHYYFRTSEEGARTTIYLATSKDVESITGKLFENCREIKMYKTANDPELNLELWKKAEELVRLEEYEKIKEE